MQIISFPTIWLSTPSNPRSPHATTVNSPRPITPRRSGPPLPTRCRDLPLATSHHSRDRQSRKLRTRHKGAPHLRPARLAPQKPNHPHHHPCDQRTAAARHSPRTPPRKCLQNQSQISTFARLPTPPPPSHLRIYMPPATYQLINRNSQSSRKVLTSPHSTFSFRRAVIFHCAPRLGGVYPNLSFKRFPTPCLPPNLPRRNLW